MLKRNGWGLFVGLMGVLLLALIGVSWRLLAYVQHQPMLTTNHSIQLSTLPSQTAITPINIDEVRELQRWGQGRVLDIAYDPTGRYLVLASTLGLYFYNAETLALDRFIETEAQVREVLFSPDGKFVASRLSNQASVQLWRVSDGTLRQTLGEKSMRSGSLAFSPDGKLLAMLSEKIILWQVDNGSVARRLDIPEGIFLKNLEFSPDGSLLASGSEQEIAIFLWDVSTGQALPPHRAQANPQDYNGVWSIAFAPDKSLLAAGAADGRIYLWDAASETPVDILEGQTTPINNLSFSSDGTLLASASRDGSLNLWQISSKTLLRKLDTGSMALQNITFSPDSRLLVAALEDGVVQAWRVDSGELFYKLTDHTESSFKSVAFSPDGATLASGRGEGTVQIQQIPSGEMLRKFDRRNNPVDSVAFSPDGARLASAESGVISPGIWDDTVHVWQLSDTSLPHILEGPRDEITGCGIFRNTVVFSPDGTILASASYNHAAQLWRVSDGALLNTLPEHLEAVLDIRFSPDGTMLATASNDGAARIWRVADGKLLQTLPNHLGGATSVAFSPDGTTLASSEATGLVRLWRVSDGELIRTLDSSHNVVSKLVFSPQGDILAFGATNNTIQLWAVDEGVLLRTITGHTGRVNSLAFSGNSEFLVSASEDGTIRFWGLPSKTPNAGGL